MYDLDKQNKINIRRIKGNELRHKYIKRNVKKKEND